LAPYHVRRRRAMRVAAPSAGQRGEHRQHKAHRGAEVEGRRVDHGDQFDLASRRDEATSEFDRHPAAVAVAGEAEWAVGIGPEEEGEAIVRHSLERGQRGPRVVGGNRKEWLVIAEQAGQTAGIVAAAVVAVEKEDWWALAMRLDA